MNQKARRPLANVFFDGWTDLFRIAVVGSLAYATLVVFLRVSGKRTLAKMNAFDLVVTVALGSTLATVLLSSEVSLSEGMLAFGLLSALQFAVAFASVRSPGFRRAIKSEPTLLVRHGELLHSAMRAERVTEDEVRAALREAGHADLETVGAVVLETNGTFSVIGGSGVVPKMPTVRD